MCEAEIRGCVDRVLRAGPRTVRTLRAVKAKGGGERGFGKEEGQDEATRKVEKEKDRERGTGFERLNGREAVENLPLVGWSASL